MLAADLIQAIDDRVRSGERNVTQIGAVVERTFDDNALVVFDGSQGAIPVKVAGDVQAYVGDRVGLVRFGTWWVVVLSMTRRWPAESGASVPQASVGTTATVNFADTPDIVEFTFTKRWDVTRVRAFVSSSQRAVTQAAGRAQVEYALRFTSPTMGVSSYTICHLYDDNTDWPLSMHKTVTGVKYLDGGTVWSSTTLPAGTYTVRVQWRRTPASTDTIQLDGEDWVCASCAEVSPT